jgi:LPS-assembly protein
MTPLRALMNLPLYRFLPRRGGLRLSAALLFTAHMVSNVGAQQAPVPPELQGSGKVISIRALSQQKDKDTWHLRGAVEVVYEGMQLQADEASFDETSGEVMARGHVVFNDPQSHLVADEVHYNVNTKKGWFAKGTGFVHPKVRPRPRVLRTENPFYFWGATVDRMDEDTYIVNHGRMTSCECESKGWSISVREARITVGDKAVAHGALFRLLGIPFFYTPLLVDSIAREPRQTGFLLPNIGNSTQKGYILGDGFFWAINPSADLMFGLEDYSKRGVSQRGEFRARPSQDSEITVDYFGVNDKDPDQALRAPGESVRIIGKADNLGYGFRGVLNVDYINTLAFRLTWSDNFTQAVSSEARQSGFLSKNFDAYSINVSAERYQNFLSTAQVPGNSVIIRQTPSVEFAGMDKQIGHWPVYFSFESSAGAMGRTEPGLMIPTLSDRLDVHPQILLRPKEFWHFHFSPTIGFRATHYGTSLETPQNAVDRLLVEIGFDLRPPSLEKVLARSYAGHRLKHVIEPDIQYHLVRARDPENIMDIVRFDDMDILTETSELEYSLTNTLLARPDGPDSASNRPAARDIFSWRLSQKYYFDPNFGGALAPGHNNVFDSTISLTGFAFAHSQRLSPVVSVLKFAPFSSYDTEIRTDLSPNGGGVLNAGITSHVRHGLFGLAFTDFFINRTASFNTPIAPTTPLSLLPSFHLLRTVATYGDVNRKGFSGAFGLDYNFAQKISQQVVGQLSYNFGCFGIDVEYRRLDLGPLRRENQFRVALALANVGTFGNLKPRERLY